jgi:glycosyltransferase involved in cell wall biosynthesis
LPVYNGDQFLVEALGSLLAQTYTDFELIISDNASDDGTAQICHEFAHRDPRVRYHRNPINIGGFQNYNLVFRMSRGEYFMYAAHDDRRASEYVERCVHVLDNDLSVVLCYTKTRYIDEHGRFLPFKETDLDTMAQSPSERFRELIRRDHKVEPCFGLIRSKAMALTGLQGQFADSDRVWMAELSLYGRFHRLPEYFMFRREHPRQATNMYPGRQMRTAWFEPTAPRRVTFPYFRQCREYFAVITRASLSRNEKFACYMTMAKWIIANARSLRSDVSFVLMEVVRSWLPPPVRRVARKILLFRDNQ